MTVSTINCKLGQVKVFDMVFNHCDKEMTGIIHNLFATTDFPNNNGALLKIERKGGLWAFLYCNCYSFGILITPEQAKV